MVHRNILIYPSLYSESSFSSVVLVTVHLSMQETVLFFCAGLSKLKLCKKYWGALLSFSLSNTPDKYLKYHNIYNNIISFCIGLKLTGPHKFLWIQASENATQNVTMDLFKANIRPN